MKKQLLLLNTTLLVLIIATIGCTQKETESLKLNKEKILGEWTENIPGTPLIVTIKFVTNISYYESINNTRIWGTYTMTDTLITLDNGGIASTFEYSFSKNWTTLTLLKKGNTDIRLELTRLPSD